MAHGDHRRLTTPGEIRLDVPERTASASQITQIA
jgi:hypothetical protein